MCVGGAHKGSTRRTGSAPAGGRAAATAGCVLPTYGLKIKKSDVRFGNKEGGGAHFGLEERFGWQKEPCNTGALYTIPAEKTPPFSFGSSTREDWKKMLENTRDLHNPNGALKVGANPQGPSEGQGESSRALGSPLKDMFSSLPSLKLARGRHSAAFPDPPCASTKPELDRQYARSRPADRTALSPLTAP